MRQKNLSHIGVNALTRNPYLYLRPPPICRHLYTVSYGLNINVGSIVPWRFAYSHLGFLSARRNLDYIINLPNRIPEARRSRHHSIRLQYLHNHGPVYWFALAQQSYRAHGGVILS